MVFFGPMAEIIGCPIDKILLYDDANFATFIPNIYNKQAI
jgi:hypothetical protein